MRAIGWLFALLLTSPPLVWAEVYRWTAPDGSVHFSDAPPKDGTQAQTLSPKTINSGSLSSPEAREAWRGKVAPPAAGKSSATPIATPGSTPDATPGAAAGVMSAAPVAEQDDRCAWRESTCFSDIENELCWYRYGRACIEMHLWKVCWQQQCDEKRLLEACDSAWDFMVRRPAALMEYRVGESLPEESRLSNEDLACLRNSGFYCHELSDDATCNERYGLDCSALRDWVPRARAKCLETRTADCDEPAVIARQRPLGNEEVRRVRVHSRDLWLEQLGALQEKDASADEMASILSDLPGLNAAASGGMHDCNWMVK